MSAAIGEQRLSAAVERRAARAAQAQAARVAAALAERMPEARIARDNAVVTVEARAAVRRAGWIAEALR